MPKDRRKQLPDAATSSPAFVRWMVTGVVLINLLVLGMLAFSLHRSYSEYQQRVELASRNLSQLLALGITGKIDTIDMALLSVADEIERQVAAGGIDARVLNAFMERQKSRLPEITSLRATDARGIVSHGPGVDPAARPDNSDREYFMRQRDNPGAGLAITRPVFARIDQQWVVPVSRPIHFPDGSFGGVVYANITLHHLANRFSVIDVGWHGSVSLHDAETRLFARYPMPPDIGKVIGEKLPVPGLAELIQSGPDAGGRVMTTTVDGIELEYAMRKIPDYPLYVVIGRATHEYMAQWKEQALKTSILAALFCLATLVSAWLVLRDWRRQMAATVELAREEEKFHTMADFTYDWEYWEGPAQEIRYMSPSCERVTGYSSSEFFAQPDLLWRIVHPDDQALVTGHHHDVAHLDEAALDFRIVRRDGEIRWIAHGCRSVFGRDGKFMGRRVTNRDITERKRAEHEIRLAYAYNRSLIEASVDPLVMIDPDGKITDLNSATELATGCSRSMLLGTDFSDYFSDPDAARAGYRQVFRDGRVRDYELEIRHRDGHLTPVLYNASIYRDDSGAVIGVFAAARDISARKQAEDALQRLNTELEQRVARRTAQLEAANRELEEFSYSISHDLRTPLRAIAGFARIIVDEHAARLDGEGRRLLDVVQGNALRMGQLIDELLEFLRLGRRHIEFGAIDTAQLVREVFAELQLSAPQRKLRLELKDPPQLWGDRSMVRRLLHNLLSNAIKFTGPRAEGVIEVGGSSDAGENHCYVSDNGVGFDMKYQDKLFKVFERVHPVGQFEGSGTGLAMVRRIVSRHGGRVWAEGQVDAGSTFHFTLPAKGQHHDTGN